MKVQNTSRMAFLAFERSSHHMFEQQTGNLIRDNFCSALLKAPFIATQIQNLISVSFFLLISSTGFWGFGVLGFWFSVVLFGFL